MVAASCSSTPGKHTVHTPSLLDTCCRCRLTCSSGLCRSCCSTCSSSGLGSSLGQPSLKGTVWTAEQRHHAEVFLQAQVNHTLQALVVALTPHQHAGQAAGRCCVQPGTPGRVGVRSLQCETRAFRA